MKKFKIIALLTLPLIITGCGKKTTDDGLKNVPEILSIDPIDGKKSSDYQDPFDVKYDKTEAFFDEDAVGVKFQVSVKNIKEDAFDSLEVFYSFSGEYNTYKYYEGKSTMDITNAIVDDENITKITFTANIANQKVDCDAYVSIKTITFTRKGVKGPFEAVTTDSSKKTANYHKHLTEEILNEKAIVKSADHYNKATYAKSCECNHYFDERHTFEGGEVVPHTYDQKVADKKYFVSNATCTEGAKYYYSCSCGKAGTEVFEYGEPLGHKGTYVTDKNETFDTDGTESFVCERCHETVSRVAEGSKISNGSLKNLTFIEASGGYSVYKYQTYYEDDRDNVVVVPATFRDKPVVAIENEAFMESNVTKVSLPNSIIKIGKSAFASCFELIEINIPNKLETIPENFVQNCYKLTSVTIPSSVKTIDNYAFSGVAFENVIVPDTVTSLGQYAFSANGYLQSITFGKGITIIPKYCLLNCSKITKIIFNGKVTELQESAFCGLDNLEDFDMPETVTTLGNAVFYRCKKLKTINLPNSITSIGSSAFSTCSTLNNITIPSELLIIKDYVFNLCSSLTDVTLNTKVTQICESAFDGTAISDIDLRKCTSLTTIKMYAFNSCKELTEVRLNNGLRVVQSYSFNSCKLLNKIYIPADVYGIRANAFSNLHADAMIYCYAPFKGSDWADNWYGTVKTENIIWNYTD